MFRGPRGKSISWLTHVLHFLWAHAGGAVVVASGGDEDIVAPGLAGLEHHRAGVVCVEVGPAVAEVPDGTGPAQGVCAQMRIPRGQADVVGALDCADLASVEQ